MRKKPVKAIILFFTISVVLFVLFFDGRKGQSPFTTRNNQLLTQQSTSDNSLSNSEDVQEASIRIDVPLESQFDEVALGNGCEVTALSMLLKYYGVETNKNALAERIHYVPVHEDATYRGDPREGFVGNIYGGDAAMGVDVEPIAEVAAQVVPEGMQIISGRDKSFDEIITVLETGTPIWMIATLELQVPTNNDFFTWETRNGQIFVTVLIHSVIITGIEGDTMYVNDPYGYKDRSVSKTDLATIYQKMGQQYLYLQK